MAKRVRDAADIQPEIDEVTKEINGVEAQVRKAKAAVEEDPQKAARATLRGIASSRSTGEYSHSGLGFSGLFACSTGSTAAVNGTGVLSLSA